MSTHQLQVDTFVSKIPEPAWGPTAPRLRVLTLTPFYPSAEDSAQGCFIAEPLRSAERFGITNEVIAAQPFYRGRPHWLHSETASSWTTYFSMPGNLGLPTAGEFLARRVTRAVRKLHDVRPFDLIHAHAALPCGRAAALLGKHLSIPFVVSVHGLDAFSTRQARGAVGTWCRRVSQHVYGAARVVICISEKVRQQVAHVLPANTVVVHNGVDPEMFAPGPEATLPLVVLSVGNLIPTKDHALLLRAFAPLARSNSRVVLEIIGDGPERVNLVRLATDLGIAGQVRFLGRQSREDVARAMRRCAVFALPSRYEGLGCVYLEAMACGKPAIGCQGQGIDEIIEHGKSGLLISPGNEAELRDWLIMLLHNQDLRYRLGAAARDQILQRHTLDHQAERLAEIYRKCVQ